jgi:hypothetical protein
MSTILEWVMLQDLKIWHQGRLQWHEFPTDLHKNLLISSEVVKG